jgi:hypothetical protein
LLGRTPDIAQDIVVLGKMKNFTASLFSLARKRRRFVFWPLAIRKPTLKNPGQRGTSEAEMPSKTNVNQRGKGHFWKLADKHNAPESAVKAPTAS